MKLYPVREAIEWKYGKGLIKFGVDITNANVTSWDFIGEGSTISRPSKSKVMSIVSEYEEYLESKKYIKLRRSEYPSFEDQMDILFNEGYDGWKSRIKAIKDKYPKPE